MNLALENKIPLVLVSGSGGTTDEVIGKINMAKGKAGITGNEDRNDAEVHKRLLLALAKVGYEVDLHSIAGKNSALAQGPWRCSIKLEFMITRLNRLMSQCSGMS